MSKYTNYVIGWDFLGWGYRVFGGDFCNSEYLIAPVVDVGADTPYRATVDGKDYDVPQQIVAHSQNESDYFSQSGTTIYEYAQSMNTDVGVAASSGAFSGSMKARFSTATSTSVFHQYTTYLETVKRYTLTLPLPGSLKLTAAFAADLADATLDGAALLDKWGTHYVAAVVVGGRAEFNATVDKASFSSKKELDLAVKTKYESGTGSGSGSVSTEQQAALDKLETTSIGRFRCVGGGVELAADGSNRDAWAASLQASPAVSDYCANGLVGIWELAGARRDELKAAYDAYVERQIEITYGSVIWLRNESITTRWLSGCREGEQREVHTKPLEKPEDTFPWTILVPVDPTRGEAGPRDGDPVRYGDKVRLRNLRENDRYLTGRGEQRAVTDPLGTDPKYSDTWVFHRDVQGGAALAKDEVITAGAIVCLAMGTDTGYWLSGCRTDDPKWVYAKLSSDGSAATFQWTVLTKP